MAIIDPFAQEAPKPRGIVDPFKPSKIVDPFAAAAPEAPEVPQEESGFIRQAADVPVGIAKGAASGVRMVADFFGAGSETSEAIKGVEDYLGGLLSAQAKRDQQEVARIMKDAEDKGVADQVLAGIKAFSVAPIDTLSQALGTSAPAIIAGLATTLTGGAPLVAAGVTAGIGGVMGAGVVKGTIYEATKEALIESGADPETAEKVATDAQSYGGENLDQILLGAGIGTVAARTGIEKAILGKVAAKEAAKQSVAKATVAEAAPEAVQAAQEQFAENIALQRQGFDVPLERGLVSSATLEAIAGGGLGAGVELATRGIKTEGPRTVEDEQIDALRNLQPDDMGEVVPPGEQVGTDTTEIRDDAGRGEPSVSMPAGGVEAAAGVVEPEAGGVEGVGGDVDGTAERAGAVDTALKPEATPKTAPPGALVGSDGKPVVIYRGLVFDKDPSEEMIAGAPRADYATFASTSPYVASSYANPELEFGERGAVTPMFVMADQVVEFPVAVDQNGLRRFDKFEFDRRAKSLQEGQVLVARNVVDYGPRASVDIDPQKLYSYGSDIYAFGPQTKTESAIGKVSTPAPTPEQKGQASLSITPSGTLTLPDIMRQEDPKLQEKFEEIRTGKKKAFKTYSPVVEDMQRTVDELSEFVRQQGADPTDLASLRSASPEVQNAARLLSALGQDANNLTLAVKNQEMNYARAKTPEAKAEVTDAAPQRKLAEAQNTVRVAREFIADPSKGVQDLAVFSNVREAPPGTRGSEARLVREYVAQIVEEWENAPRIEVVQSITELPPYMQEQILRDKVNPQGAYDPVSNLVFLVSDNIPGRDEIFTVVAHEALGHFGLRSILGSAYTRVMNEIYNGHKEVKKAADAKLKDNTNMSREIAVEEVLAEMAETNPKPTPPLRRLFEAIRRFARRVGIPLRTVTDNDLQQLIANASRYVRRNAMKFDPFTRGEVQPGGPRAVTGDKAVFDVVKRDARLSDKRLRDLFSSYGYIGEDSTNAYIGFVRPKDFLEATTGDAESLAAMRETEFRPLDKEKLAAERNPIFLNVKKQSENFGAPMATVSEIIGHEGRHRMMALEAAGVQEVPVVFVNGMGSGMMGEEIRNPEIIDRLDLDGQMFNDGSQGPGFTATNLIPISRKYYKQIKETFGGEADVVFSAPTPGIKQIQAVFSQFKSEAGPNLQNPGKAPSKLQQLSGNRPIWDKVKGAFNLKSVGSLPPSAKQAMYKIMTLRMLKDLAGKRLPQMANAIAESEKMVAERSRIMRAGADILDKVQDLRKEKNGEKQIKLLGELAVQATMLETDPDPKSKFHKANKTLTDAWNTLSPKAQEIYKEMRQFYENQIDGMVQDMLARVDRNITDPVKRVQMRKDIMDEFGPAKRKGPYFPLRRFGQYWFQVGRDEDKEFYMFESVGDRDFWMAERQKELIAAGRQNLADSISSGDSLRGDDNSLNSALASEPIMKKVEKMVDDASKKLADPAKKARAVEELKDGIKQLQYLLLPSSNLRKAFIHRKGIPGASPDLVRVFSTSAVNLAYQRARVKYSEQFYNIIESGYGALDQAPNTQETRTVRDLLNELNSRASHIIGLEPTGALEKTSNIVTQGTFLWLLTAPASAMVNVFGAGAVAMPYIGARYGYDKAMGKISSYAAKYVATAPKVKEGNTFFPTLDKSTNLDPIQAAAYQQFLHDNTIDVSLTQDIMGLGQAPFEDQSLAKNRLVRGVSALFHHSERMSREIMNMAAFDLAYADNVKKGMAPGVGGQAFLEAIETAKDLTMMSIGDFTRASKPPILTGPVTRIVFQFKQYSLLMTYNILRNTMIGFNPRRKGLTEDQKAEAREARRRMYGVLGVTALFAGLKGMPIFTISGMIAEVINTIFGDDEEEEFIFEYWLQKELADAFGGAAAASLMTGLIANATNTALSERMSLDLIDLWFRDGTYQKSAEDTMMEQFTSLLGPSVSIGLSVGRAIDLHNNGQTDRALEAVSPTILRNLQIVGRYVREGEAATARGVTIDDDISYSDLFARGLGFTPEDIMRKQKAIIDRKGVQTKIEARRERILSALQLSVFTGDSDLYNRTMEKINEYNEAFPEFPIDNKTIKQSLGRKLDDIAKQEALGGVSERLYGRIEEAIPTRD